MAWDCLLVLVVASAISWLAGFGWGGVGADGDMDGRRGAVNEGTGHGNKLRISSGQEGVRELLPGYQNRPQSRLHHRFSTPGSN